MAKGCSLKMISFILLQTILFSISIYSSNPPASELGRIVSKAKAFSSTKTNKRFMVRGVAYQPTLEDPFCEEQFNQIQTQILPMWKYLNINTVRIYQVDPTKSHDKVMELLAANGIYVIVAIATPEDKSKNINRFAPVYTKALYNRLLSVIDAFYKYTNVLAFSVGNEVVMPGLIFDYTGKSMEKTVQIQLVDAAIVKSMIRDAKIYMEKLIKQGKLDQSISVGMAIQDDPTPSLQPDQKGIIGTEIVAKYYACSSSDPDLQNFTADFIGFNSYSYTPNGDINAYLKYVDQYAGIAYKAKDFPVPTILTESGATVGNTPRDWKIVTHVYNSTELINTLSGQIAFSFFDTDHHGLFYKNFTPTAFGGIENLAEQFSIASKITPTMPTNPPINVACPENFNPDLVPAPNSSNMVAVTVKNYSNFELYLVQDAKVVGNIMVGSPSSPSLTKFQVNTKQELHIQKPATWDEVCYVPLDTIKEGLTISNNVLWGSPCNLS